MKKAEYYDIMEQLVSAYSIQQIEDYIAAVREKEVWEHGFPRLAANLGILMAHGKLLHLKKYFLEMMELCCRDIPIPTPDYSHRGNDFSVKELCWCILELEKSDVFSKEEIDKWKQALAALDPHSCYNEVAPVPVKAVPNWAAFNAASEQIRNFMGLASTADYIDNQVASQMFSFEENGMYRDPHEPMVYDTVTRLQLCNVLYFGYNGTHKAALEANLRKSGKLSLLMQSVTGELPFGGRSNCFLHNESHLAAIFEYEALRSKQDGDMETASICKAAAQLAAENIKKWWQENPDHHIKNYYPIYSMEGCEGYAYYDKYMVTAASMLYNACLFADDSIPVGVCPAASDKDYTWQSGPWFHKLFCKQDDYFVELEYEANLQYDASGIGRIHRRGAPSAICLSLSASQTPKYQISTPNPHGMAICAGFCKNEWQFALTPDSKYEILSHRAENGTVSADWQITMPNGKMLHQKLTMEGGIRIVTESDGLTGLMLPIFAFDGANYTEVAHTKNSVAVHYQGWVCRYNTDGKIADTGFTCTNRNGQYRIFRAEGSGAVAVNITIDRE